VRALREVAYEEVASISCNQTLKATDFKTRDFKKHILLISSCHFENPSKYQIILVLEVSPQQQQIYLFPHAIFSLSSTFKRPNVKPMLNKDVKTAMNLVTFAF